MPQLLAKLRREAARGTRVVSHDFVFPGWPPERVEIVRSGVFRSSALYCWRME
jgi:hypothetical protein